MEAKHSLQEAGTTAMSSLFAMDDTKAKRKPPSTAGKRHRSSQAGVLQQQLGKLTIEAVDPADATRQNRYESAKKIDANLKYRDIQIQRENRQKEKKLLQQAL